MNKNIKLNKIYNEDCLNTMKKISMNFVDGIITSPPYNIGHRKDCYYDNGYNEIDNLLPEDYLERRIKEFIEFDRIVKDKGVICYNISYHTKNPILPIQLINKINEETNLTLTDIITWKKSHSIPFQTSPTKLSRITEQIYIIVHKNYLHGFTTNKKISKINEKTSQKFYKNYTNFIKAKNNDSYKCNLKSAFSQELVDKLINIYFPKNSLIYDPFSGIGTTQLSCIRNNCKYIGSELYKEQLDIINKRINKNKKVNNILNNFK